MNAQKARKITDARLIEQNESQMKAIYAAIETCALLGGGDLDMALTGFEVDQLQANGYDVKFNEDVYEVTW